MNFQQLQNFPAFDKDPNVTLENDEYEQWFVPQEYSVELVTKSENPQSPDLRFVTHPIYSIGHSEGSDCFYLNGDTDIDQRTEIKMDEEFDIRVYKIVGVF